MTTIPDPTAALAEALRKHKHPSGNFLTLRSDHLTFPSDCPGAVLVALREQGWHLVAIEAEAVAAERARIVAAVNQQVPLSSVEGHEVTIGAWISRQAVLRIVEATDA